MNFKNIILTLIICGLMAFSFASCGDTTTNKPTENNAVSQSAETTQETTENVANEEGADSQKGTNPQTTQKATEKNNKKETKANKKTESDTTSNEAYIEIDGDNFEFFD